MTNEVVLAAAIVVPAVIFFLLRINGAVALLSLCAGSVLVGATSSDTTSLIASTFSKNQVSEPVIKIALLLLPLALCVIFMRKSISASKSLLNIVPSLAAGVLGLLLVVPLLPGGVQANITSGDTWRALDQSRELAVAGTLLLSFLFLLVTKPREHGLGKHKKH